MNPTIKGTKFSSLPFIYGTAWKEEQTAKFVALAISKGFRGIDTANQRKHYYEKSVGDGIAEGLNENGLSRNELFIQSKFTYQAGQDHRLPYDPNSPLNEQVKQSFASSLEHLQTDYLDSYILHGPYYVDGVSDEDWQVWSVMEELYKQGLVRHIGVSNIRLDQLKELIARANVLPSFVQNRCFAIQKWDGAIRQICSENKIHYQGFSLLTANQAYLNHPQLLALVKQYDITIAQLLFRFSQQIGILPLTGTTDPIHMEQDLSCDKGSINEKDIQSIENIAMS